MTTPTPPSVEQLAQWKQLPAEIREAVKRIAHTERIWASDQSDTRQHRAAAKVEADRRNELAAILLPLLSEVDRLRALLAKQT